MGESIEAAWSRVAEHAGEQFNTISGLPFTYVVANETVTVSRTDYQLSKSNFERALALLPAAGPGQLQEVRGPSYTWAILMDPRVRE